MFGSESLCICLNKQHEGRLVVNHYKTEALQPVTVKTCHLFSA